MVQIKRINRKSVSEEVFDQIVENINKQSWLPGSRLPSENELAERFGVSRVSVRAAIQKLVALNLLESRNGEGTFVKEINAGMYLYALIPMLVLKPRDILELLEFRKGIERLSCELAAERASPEDIETLGQILDKMKKSCGEDDYNQFTMEDFNFHLCISRISQNSVVESVMMILKDHMIAHFVQMNSKLGLELNIEFHEKVYEAIKNRDPRAAGFYMEESLKRSSEKVKELGEKI